MGNDIDGAGKGDARRPESKAGRYERGYDGIRWHSNVDTRSEAVKQEEYVREENEMKRKRRLRNAI